MHTTDFDIDLAEMVDDLHQRLEWARTQIELPAGRYETVLPPSAVADLMIYTYWTAAARDAEEGRSVFSGDDGTTRIGEQLTELPLTLRSDPAGGGFPSLACAPFEIAGASGGGLQSVFDNGAPIAATDWITDGRLAELMRTRNWAAQTGAQPRPSIGNLIFGGPRDDAPTLREMIGNTQRGLAADLPLVHPRGRSADAVAYRAHARRRLPDRGRAGEGRREQLPVQRVAGRFARANYRGRREHANAAARVGRLLQPGGNAPDPGTRLQYVHRQPRFVIDQLIDHLKVALGNLIHRKLRSAT